MTPTQHNAILNQSQIGTKKAEKKYTVIGKFMSRFRGTPHNEISNKKQPQRVTLESLEIPEEYIIQKVDLPTFLLSSEEYGNIKIPQMKNFTYKEKENEEEAEQAEEDKYE